jgi:hypothetical protein
MPQPWQHRKQQQRRWPAKDDKYGDSYYSSSSGGVCDACGTEATSNQQSKAHETWQERKTQDDSR